MKKLKIIGLIVLLIAGAMACGKVIPGAPENNTLLDGPIEGLNPEQKAVFLRGDVAFNDEIFTPETGLGPLFVATSCGTCHAGDGKGHPFTALTRFGQTDSTGNQFLHLGGPQLQHRAVAGFQFEQIPAGATSSRFLPPANTGLGFIDAVPDAAILALADEFDANGDGISGRPNWIPSPEYTTKRPGTVEHNGKYIGRFGKKAAVYDLMQQTANAYNQDMGITSSYEYNDTYTGREIDPEVSNQTVLDVLFYLKTLKAPIQRNQTNKEVLSGQQTFISTGCAKCHTPTLTTGPSSIAVLNYKTFHPFSDMLLHDMGSGLDDGYTEGSAKTPEWRTPALWGLGLSKNSQGGQVFLMHDGRAKSIGEAILMHGGEALRTKDNYLQLNETDKANLIKFLESL